MKQVKLRSLHRREIRRLPIRACDVVAKDGCRSNAHMKDQIDVVDQTRHPNRVGHDKHTLTAVTIAMLAARIRIARCARVAAVIRLVVMVITAARRLRGLLCSIVNGDGIVSVCTVAAAPDHQMEEYGGQSQVVHKLTHMTTSCLRSLCIALYARNAETHTLSEGLPSNANIANYQRTSPF